MRSLPLRLLPLIAACAAAALRAESADDAVKADLAMLPAYAPNPVPFPTGAPYVTADGAIMIVGYKDAGAIVEGIDRRFVAAHPGFKFALVLKETYAAPPALASGVAAFGVMGAEFEDIDAAAYRKLVGSYPIEIKFAHDAPRNPVAMSGPMAILVNRENPIAELTTDQVARIFSAGSVRGGLTKWGQVGLTGAWADKPIQPGGISFDIGIGAYMQQQFDGRPSAPSYKRISQSADVVAWVAATPNAIGFAAMNLATPGTKVLSIRTGNSAKGSDGDPAEVMAGQYPYDRHLLLYARQPLEAWAREYLRLVLSREGQEAVAADTKGYLPLNAGEISRQRAILER